MIAQLTQQAAERMQGPQIEWFTLLPLLILLGGGLLLLVLGALTPPWPRGLYAYLSASTALAALVTCFFQWHRIGIDGASITVGGALDFDYFSVFATMAVCGAVVLASLITAEYLRREEMDGPEVYGLYLMAAIGAIVMAAANDLIVLFLGLETMSIAMYVLAASHRRRLQSQESGIKYFVMGGFSSAFFLYGVALVYGGAGSTRFDRIVAAFNDVAPTQQRDVLVLAGVALLIVGLAFKAAAVPFHFWSPDVYEGAPTPVTSFLASVGKIAAFAAMLRVLVIALPQWSDDWQPVIWVIAVLTLVVGSALAVVQTNVKRMLAYSSISHAGFVLVGVEAAAHGAGRSDLGPGIPSALLYVMLYAGLVLGTFAVVTVVSRRGDVATDLAAFRGLGKERPALALAMTVFLLAQAGVPLTSGFVAKFGVIQAAVDVDSYAIAIIAMVASVIAAFLYLRIMFSMWFADATDAPAEPVRVPFSTGLAITIAVAFTLVIGFAPGWLIDASETVNAIAGR